MNYKGLTWPALAAAKLRTDARKWVLSKLSPEIYGDRLQVTGNTRAGATIKIHLPSKGTDPAVTIDGQTVDISDKS